MNRIQGRQLSIIDADDMENGQSSSFKSSNIEVIESSGELIKRVKPQKMFS